MAASNQIFFSSGISPITNCSRSPVYLYEHQKVIGIHWHN